MEILDDLTGYEFERAMVDMFEELGFLNVQIQPKSGDVGRDIIMEEDLNGERRAVIVECKHKNKVGRPDIQKLYSATLTYEYKGNKRSILITSGTFSKQARNEAEKLNSQDNAIGIELLDGHDIIEKGKEVGLDLYNGKIEIICNQSLKVYNLDDPNYYLRQAFEDIKHFDPTNLPEATINCTFYPFISSNLRFEKEVELEEEKDLSGKATLTDWGINDDEELPNNQEVLKQLINGKGGEGLVPNQEIELAELDQGKVEKSFDSVEVLRFSESKTDVKTKLRNHIKDSLRNKYRIQARKEGSDFVHDFTLSLNQEELYFEEFIPFYVPFLKMTVNLKENIYHYNCFVSADNQYTTRETIHECKQCGTTKASDYHYCENCGSINCPQHIKTERLEGTPICTGCAITDNFMSKKKYFYNSKNLKEFRKLYMEMPFYEKLQENEEFFERSIFWIILFIIALLIVIGLVMV